MTVTSFFRDSTNYRYGSLRWLDHGRWVTPPDQEYTVDNSIYGAVIPWDPDGEGPSPTLLVVERLVQSYGPTQIMLFDGVNFTPLGAEFDKIVDAICAVDHDANPATPSRLYVGGLITTNNAVPTRYIAQWDGTAWVPVGGGLESFARFMVAWDPDGPGPSGECLAVAGEFVRAGGQVEGDGSIATVGLAVWDGINWTGIPQPIEFATTRGMPRPWIQALTTWDQDGQGPLPARVVVGGVFHTPDNAIQNLLFWDGVTMSGIAPTNNGRTVWGLSECDHDQDPTTPERLLVVTSEAVTGYHNSIHTWDGSSFSRLGKDELVENGAIVAIVQRPASEGTRSGLLLFGDFERVGDLLSRRIVEWTGREWTPPAPAIAYVNNLSGGLSTITQVPVDRDSAGTTSLLLTGAALRDHNGQEFAGLARWDGAWWQTVEQDVFQKTRAAVSWDSDGSGPLPPALVVAGSIIGSGAGDVPVIYRLGHAGWSRLGEGPFHLPVQLIAWDHDANSDTADILVSRGGSPNSLEWLDGEVWRRMQLPPSASPRQMCVADLDGPGPNPPTLFVASNGAVTDAVRSFSAPDAPSQTLGNGLTSYYYYPTYVAAPTCYQMISWDVDGPGPGLPKLYWFGSPVHGFYIYGSYALQWNGQAWIESPQSFGTMGKVMTFRPDGPNGSEAIAATDIYGTFKVRRNGQWTSIAPFSGASLAPWDIDGPGPEPERVAVFGTRMDWNSRALEYGVHVYVDSPIPWIARSPADWIHAQDDRLELTASPAWGYAERDEGLTYQWRRDGAPVANGPAGASPAGGTVSGASGTLFGTRDLTLSISGARRSDTGYYDLVVTNSCGSAASGLAEIYVEPACPADIDDSGALNELDIARFLSSYEIGHAEADLDRSGGVDASDLAAFFDSYANGCP